MRWAQPKNNKRLHVAINRLNTVKTWQLIVVLVIAMLVAATLLRLNNLGMIERRDAVAKADASGDKTLTKQKLVELQKYVAGHMNTNLEQGIYLVSSYSRDRDAALSAAADTSNPQSAVYQQASVTCRERFQGGAESFRNDYVQCVLQQVTALSASQDPTAGLNLPKAENYRYNFSSPLWSPDLAGIAVLFCVVATSVIFGRLIALVALRWMLRSRYRSL